jgi:hypothetical protein
MWMNWSQGHAFLDLKKTNNAFIDVIWNILNSQPHLLWLRFSPIVFDLALNPSSFPFQPELEPQVKVITYHPIGPYKELVTCSRSMLQEKIIRRLECSSALHYTPRSPHCPRSFFQICDVSQVMIIRKMI